MRNPYLKFRDKELTLNDYLAIDRTTLANERTFLAYGRTALAMIIIGGSLLKLFETRLMHATGLAFIGGAMLLAAYGWRRYLQVRNYVSVALETETGERQHPLEEAVETSREAAREKKDSESEA
jgi:putative membrane protein